MSNFNAKIFQREQPSSNSSSKFSFSPLLLPFFLNNAGEELGKKKEIFIDFVMGLRRIGREYHLTQGINVIYAITAIQTIVHLENQFKLSLF